MGKKESIINELIKETDGDSKASIYPDLAHPTLTPHSKGGQDGDRHSRRDAQSKIENNDGFPLIGCMYTASYSRAWISLFSLLLLLFHFSFIFFLFSSLPPLRYYPPTFFFDLVINCITLHLSTRCRQNLRTFSQPVTLPRLPKSIAVVMIGIGIGTITLPPSFSR